MELEILYAIQNMRSELLDSFMKGITFLGDSGWFFILLTLLMLIFVKDKRCGLAMAFALIVNLVICNLVLKNVFMRERPCWIDQTIQLLIETPKDYSFPSGHTSASFSASLVLWRYHKKLGSASLVLAVLIAFSRLYLFVHWPTDVLGGIAVAFVASYCGKMIAEELAKKYPKITGQSSLKMGE